MRNGTIKTLKQGFGFITPEDASGDVFFHNSVVADGKFNSLQEGASVMYEAESSPKGPKATSVTMA